MPDDRSSDLLGQLPRTRPHRRSTKRPERAPGGSISSAASDDTSTTVAATGEDLAAARPKQEAARPAQEATRPKQEAARPAQEGARTARLPQPAQPRGIPSASRPRPPRTDAQPSGTPILKTAAQATAELAEIGLALGVRALQRAIDRFPRP